MKKFLWTAFVALASASAAALTTAALDYAWRRFSQRPPPRTLGWARLLVAAPTRKRVLAYVQPGRA